MTDWKKIKHHRGKASDIPKIVADMLGGPATPQGQDARFNQHLTLQDRLYREGEWVEAVPATIELLFESMSPAAQDAYRIPWHISLLTTGGAVFALKNGLPLPQGTAPFQRQTLETTLKYEGELKSWLKLDDPFLRSMTGRLLGMLPGADQVRMQTLKDSVAQYPDDLGSCNTLHGMGLLARYQGVSLDEVFVMQMMAPERSEIVRRGAALAWIWNELDINDQLLDALVAWGDHTFELDWNQMLDVLPLLPASQAYKEQLVVDWLRRWIDGSSESRGPIIRNLFTLIGSCEPLPTSGPIPAPVAPRRSITDFSTAEQKLIRLSGHPKCVGKSVMPGVPVRWLSRRRWLGTDPSTLLEQPCSFEPNTQEPVWYVWWKRIAAGNVDDWGLPSAWKGMSDLERLELVCEAKIGSYNLERAVWDVTGDQVQKLAERCGSPQFENWALGFLSRVGAVPEGKEHGEVGGVDEYATPLMNVLLQRGVLLPNAVNPLVIFDDRDARPFILQLPLEQRRKILHSSRRHWRTFQFIVPLLEVYPFKEYAAVALEGVLVERVTGSERADRLLGTVISLAETHAEIAEALAEARARPEWPAEK